MWIACPVVMPKIIVGLSSPVGAVIAGFHLQVSFWQSGARGPSRPCRWRRLQRSL